MPLREALAIAAPLAVSAWWLTRRYLLQRGWAIWPALALVVLLPVMWAEVRAASFESMLARAAAPVTTGLPASVGLSSSGGGYSSQLTVAPAQVRSSRWDLPSFACERLLHGLWRSDGHVGEVWFTADGVPQSPAWLSSTTCSRIRDEVSHPDPGNLDGIVALHTVVHEAAHLAGVQDETGAECLAMSHDVEVWQRLGIPAAVAQTMLQRYRTEVRPRLPEPYTGPCPS
ncbi:MAG: hypothetical protein ACTHMW_03790 [Actinomycetes bacterium]